MSKLKTHLRGITLHSTYHLTFCHQRLLGEAREFKNITTDPRKVTCKRCLNLIEDKFRVYVVRLKRRNGKLQGRWKISATGAWEAEHFVRNNHPCPRGSRIESYVYKGKNLDGVVSAA